MAGKRTACKRREASPPTSPADVLARYARRQVRATAVSLVQCARALGDVRRLCGDSAASGSEAAVFVLEASRLHAVMLSAAELCCAALVVQPAVAAAMETDHPPKPVVNVRTRRRREQRKAKRLAVKNAASAAAHGVGRKSHNEPRPSQKPQPHASASGRARATGSAVVA